MDSTSKNSIIYLLFQLQKINYMKSRTIHITKLVDDLLKENIKFHIFEILLRGAIKFKAIFPYKAYTCTLSLNMRSF